MKYWTWFRIATSLFSVDMYIAMTPIAYLGLNKSVRYCIARPWSPRCFAVLLLYILRLKLGVCVFPLLG